VEGGGSVVCASGGDEIEGAWGGASRHLSQYGQPGVYVLESGSMEGGGRARGASDEVSSRVLGAEHPDKLTSMKNLAFTIKRQGRNAEAIKIMGEYVQLRTQVLGAEHPDALSSSRVLAEWKMTR
jgi:hypothetical protein